MNNTFYITLKQHCERETCMVQANNMRSVVVSPQAEIDNGGPVAHPGLRDLPKRTSWLQVNLILPFYTESTTLLEIPVILRNCSIAWLAHCDPFFYRLVNSSLRTRARSPPLTSLAFSRSRSRPQG